MSVAAAVLEDPPQGFSSTTEAVSVSPHYIAINMEYERLLTEAIHHSCQTE